MKLAGRRSPAWAFCEKFVVPDYDTDDDYLIRWRIISTPWFGIYLHRIGTPDPRPTLHDHPWPFVAVVLRGGYDQQRRDTHHWDEKAWEPYSYHQAVIRLNVMPLDSLHWISRLHRVPTWTLVFVGRRQRTWGYLDLDGTYTPFHAHPYNDEFLEALAQRKEREAGRRITAEERERLDQWDKKAL